MRLEDERGAPLPHAQVKVSCPTGGSSSAQSGESGWLYGALPLDCAPQGGPLHPQLWDVHIEATERSVRSSERARFLPRQLEGSWRISNLRQGHRQLTYLLEHSLKVPHPIVADIKLRPCLHEEARSQRPVTLPTALLSTQMRAEELSYTTLSTHSLTGVRKLPFQRVGLKVGCYVLSASSEPSPWAQLLEARALFWLKGRLDLKVEELNPHVDHLLVKGVISAPEAEQAWGPESLTQALSSLNLKVRLSPVGLDVDHDSEATSQLASLTLRSAGQLEGRSSWSSATWRAQVPFPHPQGAGASYLVSLHLSKGLRSLPEERLLPQAIKPKAVSAWGVATDLLSQLDVWFLLALCWVGVRRLPSLWSARRAQRATREGQRSALPALYPTWSPATPEPTQPEGLFKGQAFISLSLCDIDTRATIYTLPSVTLSAPDPIFHTQLLPELTPSQPKEGAHLIEARAGVMRVELSEQRVEELQRGETLWLWLRVSGYEGCVVSLSYEHLNQRLTLPLWDLRAALKRQLLAISARHKQPERFGRASLEALRGQLKDPSLTPWLLQAEALLYDERAPQEREALEVAWALSEGTLTDTLSPYDARAIRPDAQRTSIAFTLTSLLNLLYLCVSIYIALALLPSPLDATPATQTSQLSFKAWRHLVSESCHGRAPVYRTLPLQSLVRAERVVLMNPHAVPSELLDWVKSGGKLLIALEPESARRSQAFLARLDLSVLPSSLDLTHERASGVWWSEYALDQSHLPPFLGSSMTHFLEGPSWYQHEIAPTWVDELGRSLGYRVKVGKGSLFLFGDADALSDDLLSVATNQLSALAFIEWLLNGQSEVGCPLTLLPPGDIQGATSTHPQLPESALHTLGASLRAWLESLAQWLSHLLSSSYGNQLVSTLCLGLWLVILSRKHLKS